MWTLQAQAVRPNSHTPFVSLASVRHSTNFWGVHVAMIMTGDLTESAPHIGKGVANNRGAA